MNWKVLEPMWKANFKTNTIIYMKTELVQSYTNNVLSKKKKMSTPKLFFFFSARRTTTGKL